MIQNVAAYKSSVANSASKHGEAFTKIVNNCWRDKVGHGECNVQGTKRVQSCTTALGNGGLQVLIESERSQLERSVSVGRKLGVSCVSRKVGEPKTYL